MQTQSSDVNVASISDAIEIATWNVQRSNEYLQNFVNSRHAALPDDIEL